MDGTRHEQLAGGAAEMVALSWQPPRTRPPLATLLALDARLAGQVRRAREPLIGQIGLAWWRDRLTEKSRANPLLASLAREWDNRMGRLAALVDGWEQLLRERPLDGEAISAFAEGRAAASAALADAVDASRFREEAMLAGRRWAYADFVLLSIDASERRLGFELATSLPRATKLPRILRGLAVLGGLAGHSLATGAPLMEGRGAALVAMRVGLLGR